jgi:hypothetical protein
MLNLISVARKSGTLDVEGVDTHASLFFNQGKLLYAAVAGQDYRLAEVLQRAGKLTEAQSRAIEAQASSSGDRELAWLLLRAGYASRSDIIREVRAHVLRNVFRVFEWSAGTFVFEPNRLSFGDRITVPIDLATVIVAGSRRLREADSFREELPNLDVHLRFTRGAGSRLRKMRMGFDEWRVVSLAGPRNTVREIADQAGLSEDQVRRIVYGLMQADLLHVALPEEAPEATSSDRRRKDRARVRGQRPSRNVITRLIDRIRQL